MFIGLLSACTIAIFGESLASNSKESIKCVSLTIDNVKLDQHVKNAIALFILFHW